MPTQIKQIDNDELGFTIFRIEGDLLIEDANLIGRLALAHHRETGNTITIDLADLDFLDSESAPILKRLVTEHGFEITGTEIFLQTLVNAAEKH